MTNPLRRTAPVAVAALLGAALVAGCGTNDATAGDGGTTPTMPTAPTTPATTSPAPATSSTTTPASGSSTLVYYVTKTSMGDRITAETTPVGTGPNAILAVQGARPIDPDYRNLVPAGSLTSAQPGGTEYTVELAKASYATASLPTADAKEAIQQIVYSVNAAGGTAAKPLPVHFVLDGKDSTYLGQPSLAKPGKQLLTLALMSVLSPTDGSTLPATKTTFSGVGSSFEATVGWKVTDAAGKTVLHGSTMAAGWMDKLYPWSAPVDLSKLGAGTYTFTASTDDASDGEGGGPITDTKTFTIG